MVERLRAKPGGDRITVTIGDFGVVDEVVDGAYALVYLVFITLFELESQERQVRCFERVAARLSPGGAFVGRVPFTDASVRHASVYGPTSG